MKKGKKSENCHHCLKETVFDTVKLYRNPTTGFSFYVWMGREIGIGCEGGSPWGPHWAATPLQGGPLTPEQLWRLRLLILVTLTMFPHLDIFEIMHDMVFSSFCLSLERRNILSGDMNVFVWSEIFNQLVSSSRVQCRLLERGPAGIVMLAS